MNTLGDIRTFIMKQIDEEDYTHFDSDEMDDYINVAYNRLCREVKEARSDYYEKQEDLSVVAGDTTIDLPSDYAGAVKLLIDTTTSPSVPLTYKPRREFTLTNLSTETNAPREFDFLGSDKLWLGCESDGSYTLQLTYEYLPADLATDASTTDFPIGYEVLIAWEVIFDCSFKSQVPFDQLYARYMQLKSKMLKSLGRPKQVATARRVRNV